MKRKAYGHIELYGAGSKTLAKDPKIQHAVRYRRSTFYELSQLCEKEGVSVNSKVNEIIESYLGVK